MKIRLQIIPYCALAMLALTAARASAQDVANNVASSADLQVSIEESADPVLEGQDVTYTLAVGNNGPGEAAGAELRIFFTEDALAGISSACQSEAGAATCAIGVLAPQAAREFTLTLRAEGVATLQVTAAVFSSTTDPESGNDSVSETTSVAPSGADLSISKVAAAPTLPPGGSVDYTLTVTNDGPLAATGVTVTDSLPEQLALASISSTQGGCQANGQALTCMLEEISAGGLAAINLRATATTAAAGSIVNTASVSGNEADGNTANNSASATVDVSGGGADLRVEIEASPNPAALGSDVNLAISVFNDGPQPAANVLAELPVPPGAVFLEATASPGSCAEEAGDVRCSVDALGAGQVARIDIAVSFESQGSASFTASASADTLDPNPSNNEAAVVVRNLQLESMVIPRSAGQENFVGVALFNPSNEPNSAMIQGRSFDGMATSQFQRPEPIQPMGQDAFVTGQVPESDTLVIQGASGPLQGFFMIGDNNSRMLDGIGSRPFQANELFLPRARQASGDSTTIYLFNPASQTIAAVTLSLFDLEGTQVESVGLDLQPRGSLFTDLGEIFGGMEIQDGYLHLVSTTPVRGFELIKSGDSFAAFQARPLLRTDQLVSPHFFVGKDGVGTRIRVINVGVEMIRASLKAFQDDGDPLAEADFNLTPGFGINQSLEDLLRINTSQLPGGSLVQGYLEVSLSTGSVGPFVRPGDVLASLAYAGVGTLSTVPLERQGSRETLFLQVAQSASIFTGLAFLNPNDEALEVTLDAFDAAGDLVAKRRRILPPRSRVLGVLNTTSFFGSTFQQTGGHLRISADQEVVALALFGGPNFLSAIGGQTPFR